MAVDGDDRLWFVETGSEPNRLVGFDPAVERFVSVTEIPSGGGSVRHMHYDGATGAVWFGTDAGTIGRAVVGRSAGSD
jgi:virginiamycin B lyase